jgi:hypothetical protein
MGSRAPRRLAPPLFGGLALLGGLAGAGAGCKRETAKTGATVESVQQGPQRHYGQEVTLNGEVDAVFGLRAFELENNDLFDEQVLVVARSDVRLGGETIADDQRVRVTGIVRPLAVVELEREIGWDLTPEVEVEFRSRPVVVAKSITRVDRPELTWAEGTAARGAGAETAAAEPTITALGTVLSADEPRRLVGRSLRLERAKVQGVAGDRAFWIGDGEKDRLLVVLEEERRPTGSAAGAKRGGTVEGEVDVDAGQTVALSGSLAALPSPREAKERWRLRASESALRDRSLYLKADRVDVVDRPPTHGRRAPERR